MLDRANFSSQPPYRREFALFTLIGRHKVHRKAQSKMSQQALTQTPTGQNEQQPFPLPRRLAAQWEGGGIARRVCCTPPPCGEQLRASPLRPACPPCDTWMTRLRTSRLKQLPYTAPTRQDTAIASKGGKRILFADTSSKDLAVPEAIDGAPVTAIAAGAFSDLAALERVFPSPTRLRPSAPRRSPAARTFATRSWAAPSNPLAKDRFAAAGTSSASICRSR